MAKDETYIECGRPIRRKSGVTECDRPAGHREWWCQDQRARDAVHTVMRMDHDAEVMVRVLWAMGLWTLPEGQARLAVVAHHWDQMAQKESA